MGSAKDHIAKLKAFLTRRSPGHDGSRVASGPTHRARLADVSRHHRQHSGGEHAGPLDLEQIHRAVGKCISIATWPNEPTLEPAVRGLHRTQVGHFIVVSSWSAVGVCLWDRVAEIAVHPMNGDEPLITPLDGPMVDEVVEATMEAVRLHVR